MTWSYRSRYPTCGESCSHPVMGKLEVHALHYPPLVKIAPVGDMGFLSRHQTHDTKNVGAMSSTNQTLTGQTGKVEEIKSDQQSLQEWCATTLEWKFESNRTSYHKDMLRESPWGDRTVSILYVPIHHMPWTAHSLRLLPVRHFVGIACFLSIPTCTLSVTKIGNVGSSCTRSELVRDDESRRRACLVPGRHRWLVVAVEARKLLAESGRAGQTAGGTTVSCVPGCFNNSSEMQGNWAFTIPRSYRSPLILICYPLAFSCHMPMIMDISGLSTWIFFWEGPLDGLATVDMQPLQHVFKFTDTLASVARFFQICDANSNIKWLILERAGSYSNTSKRCNFCLAEAVHSLFADKHPSLNKKDWNGANKLNDSVALPFSDHDK